MDQCLTPEPGTINYLSSDQRKYQLFIIQMFRRFAQLIQKALPLSAVTASCLLSLSIPQMAEEHAKVPSLLSSSSPLSRNLHPKIKYVRNLEDCIEKIQNLDRSIIVFQLTGDPFIDEQVQALALQFVNNHQNDISADFEFIFLSDSRILSEDMAAEKCLIIFGPFGQKMISIDNYLNQNKEKQGVKINNKPLMKRLTESLNTYKQVGLENISTELKSLDQDSNYVALYTASKQNYNVQGAIKALKTVQKKYSIKAKCIHKYVIKDEQTKRIFGLKSENDEKVYLLVPDNQNLRKQFRQKADFFTINGKRFTNIDISSSNLNEIFVFPPVQKSINPIQFVLNIYINKNQHFQKIQEEVFQQLSKPEYAKYSKALYYTSDVEQAAIFYEQNDYSSASLLAYENNTTLDKAFIKDMLTHTFQYQFPLSSAKSIDGTQLQKWIQDCGNHKAVEYFQSEKGSDTWAQQITGEEYKQIRDQPGDKIIYHYSNHCHGCKKFGGKYEEFAKNKALNHPNISFYRINNDFNKSEGVKNFNSTPVFVFYKKDSPNPFIYKMPFFTEKLFDSFLKITSEIKLTPLSVLQNHIKERSASASAVNELLSELKI